MYTLFICLNTKFDSVAIFWDVVLDHVSINKISKGQALH